MVMSADHPGLTFSLSLIRSEPTYNQPVQQWSFVSDFAVKPQPLLYFLFPRLLGCLWNTYFSLSLQVRDYSGTYTVKLIACTTAPHQEYSLPVICNPRDPITFDLDIRFQQVPPQWHLCHVFFSVRFPNCLCGLVIIVLETEFTRLQTNWFLNWWDSTYSSPVL